jgi:amidophosphoribosyltransferase
LEEVFLQSWHEACGIIAISGNGNQSNGLINKVYMGLFGLQHRGQESAGIALAKDGAVHCYKDKGLVSEVFNEKILSVLSGDLYLGHVKYSGEKDNFAVNAQPYVVNYKNGSLAVAFNGALTNARELRRQMEDEGTVFATHTDCELITLLIAKNDTGDVAGAVKKVTEMLRGGYAMAFMTEKEIIGVRDPYGIRPLCLGTVEGRYTLASESCALDMMEGTFIRDIEPGEIIRLENGHYSSIYANRPPSGERAGCIFEYVYFANPDSTLDGKNVYICRERAGYIMARECPATADIVIGVPDSGNPAALGFARGSGIPYAIGLIKNKYVGRTFIQPTQSQREMSVRIKLNPIRPVLEGKRVVLVDDSIVRGTTMRHVISAMRRAGAAEVHLRISSPPVMYGCRFGVDTNADHLLAVSMNTEEVCRTLGANSLGYISIDGMMRSLEESETDCVKRTPRQPEAVGGPESADTAQKCPGQYCVGCFNGCYPNMEIDGFEQLTL